MNQLLAVNANHARLKSSCLTVNKLLQETTGELVYTKKKKNLWNAYCALYYYFMEHQRVKNQKKKLIFYSKFK